MSNFLNKTAGLTYFSGDEDAYLQTLREFKKVHGGDLEGLKSLLIAKDYKSACRMAHTLKSSSAFIGAEILSGMALNAENALKIADRDIPDNFDEILAELEKAFLQTMAEFNSLPELELSNAAFDREKALAFIEQLLPMLEVSDAGAYKLRSEIEEIIVPFGSEGGEFLSLVEGFAFPEAAKLLLKIKGML